MRDFDEISSELARGRVTWICILVSDSLRAKESMPNRFISMLHRCPRSKDWELNSNHDDTLHALRPCMHLFVIGRWLARSHSHGRGYGTGSQRPRVAHPFQSTFHYFSSDHQEIALGIPKPIRTHPLWLLTNPQASYHPINICHFAPIPNMGKLDCKNRF